MTKSKSNNSTNLSSKEYITAELESHRIIGKLKQSLEGPEVDLLKKRGLVLVGPYWIAPLSGGPFSKCDEELLVKNLTITAWHTHDELLADSFDFFL